MQGARESSKTLAAMGDATRAVLELPVRGSASESLVLLGSRPSSSPSSSSSSVGTFCCPHQP